MITQTDDRVPTAQDWAAAQARIANLEIALETNRRISLAMGILMGTCKVTEQAAFDMMTLVSQKTHRKLHSIARTSSSRAT